MQTEVTKRYARGVLAGLVTAVAIAVPTDIIDTPMFSRDIPVRWWEYPVLGATGVLTAAWFALGGARRATGPMASGLALVTFAVGCPVCNKLVLLAVGASGALSLWAPLQPALAALSLALLMVLVVLRWRRRPCVSDSCTAALRNPLDNREFRSRDRVSPRAMRRSG
ncbi:hypothetical protein ABQF26_09455 [Mycolicibacterium elephantis]